MPDKSFTSKITDDVLVQQGRRGDFAALEALMLRYQDRLYNVILRICTNRDDAAELTQETFVKVIENIGKFQGKSSFYTWSFRIAVNLTLNHCRRNARIGFCSMDTEQTQVNQGAAMVLRDFISDDKSPDPVNIAQNKELCEIVSACLMKLDDMHRTIITLRDIEGMSYAQMAKVLNVELGTVRSRLSRARKNLREILENVLK